MESGDTVLILLNRSNLSEVLRRRVYGRAKPYFEKVDGTYVLRPPPISLWERWSDWSRVASVVARLVDRTPPESLDDPSQSIEIIRIILGRIREEVPYGVRVVLAHQGTRDFLVPKLGFSSTIFCQFADVCVDLDDVLEGDPVHLLPDGHWSASSRSTQTSANSQNTSRKSQDFVKWRVLMSQDHSHAIRHFFANSTENNADDLNRLARIIRLSGGVRSTNLGTDGGHAPTSRSSVPHGGVGSRTKNMYRRPSQSRALLDHKHAVSIPGNNSCGKAGSRAYSPTPKGASNFGKPRLVVPVAHGAVYDAAEAASKAF